MSIFTKVKIKRPKRTKFNLSNNHKFSTRLGRLTPIFWHEVMPGDSFKGNSEVFVRFAPLIAPVMENYKAHVYFFFVPNRLIWDSWEDFIGKGTSGDLTPQHPYVAIGATNWDTDFAESTLADYLGIPPLESAPAGGYAFPSVLPFRAYNLIYNEYFRDQTLNVELPISKADGADTTTNLAIQDKSWHKTYFHAALPFAQRGQEVTLPFSNIQYKTISEVKDASGLPVTTVGTLGSDASGNMTVPNISPVAGRLENIDNIGAPTINELRKAYRLQEWLENNARAGARYIEQIKSHFGVDSKDSRLQRPEFLGSGSTNVVVSEVLNTTGLSEVSPGDGGVQGRMAGHGVSLGRTNSFKRYFTEHGIVMGLLSITSAPSYWQGLHRKFNRTTFLDYPFPEFANLGEQAITNKEIYLSDDTVSNDATFGYIPQYADFKTGFNQISGAFRTSLDFWHHAQKYSSTPPLNGDFMRYQNDDRVWNVIDQSVDNLYVQVRNNITAIRPLPYFGTPRT